VYRLPSIIVDAVNSSVVTQQELGNLHVAVCSGDVELITKQNEQLARHTAHVASKLLRFRTAIEKVQVYNR